MTLASDTTTPGPAARIGVLLEQVLSGSAVFAVDVVVRGRTGSHVVEVFVDSDAPLGANELAVINRQLGAAIEAEDFIRGSWRLDVSTPGAERPLKDARQYPKHVGRTLSVLVAGSGGDESRAVTGELRAVDSVSILLVEKDGTEHRVPFDALIEAKVQLPW